MGRTCSAADAEPDGFYAANRTASSSDIAGRNRFPPSSPRSAAGSPRDLTTATFVRMVSGAYIGRLNSVVEGEADAYHGSAEQPLSTRNRHPHPSRERSRSGRSRRYRAGRFTVDVTPTTKELREPRESSVWGCRRTLQVLLPLGGKFWIFLHSVKLVNLKMLKINQLTLWHDSCTGSPVLYS